MHCELLWIKLPLYDDLMMLKRLSLCQLACYDQAKQLVLGTGLMGDNILTHFLSSFIAVSTEASDWSILGYF